MFKGSVQIDVGNIVVKGLKRQHQLYHFRLQDLHREGLLVSVYKIYPLCNTYEGA